MERTSTVIDLSTIMMRASAPLSSRPRPFVRWAGSKRGLLKHLVPHLPREFGTYHEPFLGSGSLFFLLQPERAYLNDSCNELIETYRAVRSDVETVIQAAMKIPMDRTTYYDVRDNRSLNPLVRAGEFLYINRACFNGIYRVSSTGRFNVPWGAPKTSFVVDPENLRACSRALSGPDVTLTSEDFEQALLHAKPGDLVFLDPPYVTRHNNNGFVDYNERLFSWRDQQRLATLAEELRARGCHVIVTNAYHPDVLALYPAFAVHEMSRSSTLAGASSKRGRVSEAILVGRP